MSKFDPSAQISDVLKLLWEKLLEQEDKAALLTANSAGIIKFALSQMASRYCDPSIFIILMIMIFNFTGIIY